MSIPDAREEIRSFIISISFSIYICEINYSGSISIIQKLIENESDISNCQKIKQKLISEAQFVFSDKP